MVIVEWWLEVLGRGREETEVWKLSENDTSANIKEVSSIT
jgi:hypothetical protein